MADNTLLKYIFSEAAEVDPEGRFNLSPKARRARMAEIMRIVNKHKRLRSVTPEDDGCQALIAERLTNVHGVLVPGAFGERGSEGMIRAVQFAREHANASAHESGRCSAPRAHRSPPR